MLVIGAQLELNLQLNTLVQLELIMLTRAQLLLLHVSIVQLGTSAHLEPQLLKNAQLDIIALLLMLNMRTCTLAQLEPTLMLLEFQQLALALHAQQAIGAQLRQLCQDNAHQELSHLQLMLLFQQIVQLVKGEKFVRFMESNQKDQRVLKASYVPKTQCILNSFLALQALSQTQ